MHAHAERPHSRRRGFLSAASPSLPMPAARQPGPLPPGSCFVPSRKVARNVAEGTATLPRELQRCRGSDVDKGPRIVATDRNESRSGCPLVGSHGEHLQDGTACPRRDRIRARSRPVKLRHRAFDLGSSDANGSSKRLEGRPDRPPTSMARLATRTRIARASHAPTREPFPVSSPLAAVCFPAVSPGWVRRAQATWRPVEKNRVDGLKPCAGRPFFQMQPCLGLVTWRKGSHGRSMRSRRF